MVQRTVTKVLAAAQDLLIGEGQSTQTRGTGSYLVDKIRLAYIANTLDEINALDTTKYTKAILFTGGTFTFYQYIASVWQAVSPASSVQTFNGRTGDVVALYNDYEADEVGFNDTAVTFSSIDVQDAIEQLDALREVLEDSLGTAAFADKTTSATDTTADSITKVGDAGWLVDGGVVNNTYQVTDFNLALTSGSAFINGVTSNGPLGTTTERGTLLVQMESAAGSAAFGSQVKIDRNIVSPEMSFRSINAGAFSSWVDVWHTGNLVKTATATDATAGRVTKVGDFGVGVAGLGGVQADAHLTLESGFYKYANGATANIPNGAAIGSFFVNAYASDSKVLFFTDISNDYVGLQSQINGSWGTARDIWHSGNKNFDTFGGIATDDIIASGTARSPTVAQFILPINSLTAPVSITVTGTFRIIRPDISVVATGVTVSYNSASSNRVAFITAVMSGATTNEDLILQATDGTSKIVVNY